MMAFSYYLKELIEPLWYQNWVDIWARKFTNTFPYLKTKEILPTIKQSSRYFQGPPRWALPLYGAVAAMVLYYSMLPSAKILPFWMACSLITSYVIYKPIEVWGFPWAAKLEQSVCFYCL